MPFLCLYVYITCELAYLNTGIIQWNTSRFTFQIIAASKHSAWPYPFMQSPTETAPCKQHWQFTVQVGMYVPYCECILWCLACNHPSPCGGKAWQYCEHHLYLWNKWYTYQDIKPRANHILPLTIFWPECCLPVKEMPRSSRAPLKPDGLLS